MRALKKLPFAAQHIFFDNSKARFIADSKLAFQAQTLNLRAFRFAKNCDGKNLNSRFRATNCVFQHLIDEGASRGEVGWMPRLAAAGNFAFFQ